jgi:hypothetical protein
MNGLYERRERDNTLGRAAGVTWINHQTGWLLLEGVKRNDDGTGREIVWEIVDDTGLERFRVAGGEYLPPGGPDWKHMHNREKYQRLKKGDMAEAKEDMESFWEAGETGKVVFIEQSGDENAEPSNPIHFRRSSDGKQFQVQGFRLNKIGLGENEKEGGAVATGADAKDDEDELPWQIVGIMNQEKVNEIKEQYADHQREVNEAIGSKSKSRQLQVSEGKAIELFTKALSMLDGAAEEAIQQQKRAIEMLEKAKKQQAIGGEEAASASDTEEDVPCRAATAVELFEQLLAYNKNFKTEGVGTTKDLRDWLVFAHVRARRCTGTQVRS